MKKISLFLVFALLLSLGLTGCKKSENGGAAAGRPSSEQAQNTQTLPIGGEAASALVYHTNSQTGTSAPNGYYRLVNFTTEEEQQCRISYIDYATRQEVYLCDQPQCRHVDETCTAFVTNDGFRMQGADLVYANDALYLIVGEPQASQGDSGFMVAVQANRVIYKMEPDGSGRTKIADIPGITVNGGIVAGGGKLYISAYRENSEVGIVDNIIVEVDTQNNTHQILPAQGTIYGVDGDRIILSEFEMPELAGLSDSAMLDALGNAASVIYQYDPKTGEKTQIASVRGKDLMYGAVAGGRFLYMSGEGAIRYVELQNGEEGLLTQMDASAWLLRVQDGKMLVQSEQGVMTVDCATGATEAFGLVTRSSKTPYPVEIFGASDGYYYVRSDIVEAEEYVAWMDVYQTVIKSEEYALITKEDFWAQNPNYLALQSDL